MAPFKQGTRNSSAFFLAVAVALATSIALPARAQFFSSTGDNVTFPVNLFPIDPAASVFDFSGNILSIGNVGTGTFAAMGGALMKGDGWTLGNLSTGDGTATITGFGTRAEIGGANNRIQVGNAGTGDLTVSAGALVDATLNVGVCTTQCFSFVGNGAGSTGTLTITGADSELRTLRSLVVGQVSVFTVAHDGFDFGTPGGTTNAAVNILDGGTLRTQTATVGRGPSGGAALGTEQSFANVVISGPGSRWLVSPNTIDNTVALFSAGTTSAGGHATITISNGGKLIVDGTGGPGPNDLILLGSNGGHADLTVTGVGSSVDVKGNSPSIEVGRIGAGSQGSFSVLAGATASSLFINVGRDGGSGTLTIDGAGSQVNLTGVGTGAAFANIGRGGGGTGQATVSNGGRLFISDGGADSRSGTGSPGLTVGRDAGGNGKLTITGAGSEVNVVSTSLNLAPGVPDNFNPFVAVGRFDGSSGELVVSNGGKLVLEGNAVSTVADSRSTSVNIGGASDTVAGGHGVALLTGAGSEIRLSGSDPFVGVGRGAGASGELTISDHATLIARNISVGRSGATGSLLVDAATVTLSGQQTGNFLSGAALTVGSGGGTGVATVTNGSVINISNPGSAGASVNVGGTGIFPLGNGTLTLAGGSQINVSAASGLATFQVARDGTGVATIKEGSSVNIGDGSTFIGRLAGSNGTLTLQGGSSLNAGYVGVGRTPSGDGGTGKLMVSDSTVTAATIEIGTNGFLGGNNGTINGSVVLHGTLSPGESPGRVIINGGLKTGSGLLLLDVQSNGGTGLAGFDLDHVILTKGSTFDFTGLKVNFNFIGATDPTAFAAAGGFNLDNFIESLDTGSGAITGLSTQFAPGETWGSIFDSSQFTAQSDTFIITDFNFSPDSGATFNAVAAVPEPETWLLMLAGLAAISGVARRRAVHSRRGR